MPTILNLIGLSFDIIGAFMIWTFEVTLWEEDSDGNITPTEASTCRRNKKLSRMGVLFLLTGFGFQFVSQLCQLLGS